VAIWHLITSEYPPESGGVSDYTRTVAVGLAAAGDEVHVWCRAATSDLSNQTENLRCNSTNVFVHRELESFTRANLCRLDAVLDQFQTPRCLLVQWVPHGYGYRSMNLPFCLWLLKRAKLKHDCVEIMVHEPFLAFGEGSRKQDLVAAVHRVMAVVLLKAASRVWVSIPDWIERLGPFVFGVTKSFFWLPVPSNIPLIDDPDGITMARKQYAFEDAHLVGHFGAYDRYLVRLMLQLLPLLLSGHDKISVMLLGKGSMELRARLIEQHPHLSDYVAATGTLTGPEISRHISACDVMLQPYQDGVSSRRSSTMTALSHGVPAVTTQGKATEHIWAESGAVSLVASGDTEAMIKATMQNFK
jgi:glycosyltransferase involved in cell wall biosynthesis